MHQLFNAKYVLSDGLLHKKSPNNIILHEKHCLEQNTRYHLIPKIRRAL